jgi:iron complex transport system substrate-binding protein
MWSFLLSCLILLGACQQAPPSSPSTTPQRIVALTPSIEETLFALGLGKRVVGVGDYCVWPPEVRSLPQLGGLFNPNLERIVALRPDFAVLIPSERDLAAKLGRLGVPTLVVRNESLADVERSFRTIAARCGVPAAGERLAAQWRRDLAPRPLPWKPRVMLSVGRQSGRLADILVAGPGTFFDEILVRMGGVNVFSDAPALYPQVSLEEVVARAPDVILELRSEAVTPEVAAALVKDWQQLPNVPAVRNGRVTVIADDYVAIPGPRLPRLDQAMRAALRTMATGALVPPPWEGGGWDRGEVRRGAPPSGTTSENARFRSLVTPPSWPPPCSNPPPPRGEEPSAQPQLALMASCLPSAGGGAGGSWERGRG